MFVGWLNFDKICKKRTANGVKNCKWWIKIIKSDFYNFTVMYVMITEKKL